jgi:hypothetical protein
MQYSFVLRKIVAISGFLFVVNNEIMFKPRHVQSFRPQTFRPEDAFEVAKRPAEVFVSDDIGVFPVAPHLFFHFVQSPLNLFWRIGRPGLES